jgi:hypothetical protein
VLSAEEIKNLVDRLGENQGSQSDRDLLAELIKIGRVSVNFASAQAKGAIAIAAPVTDSVVVAISDGGTFIYQGDTAARLQQVFEKYLNT